MAKKRSFEDSLNNLENITNKMEEDISIQEAFKLYKKGIEEAIFCSEFLKNMQKEVQILQKDLDGNFKLDKFEILEE